MTLIVGILCSDGVVLGADGAATYGALGQQTMRQPMKKLTIISNSVILGVSGTTGLAQRYAGEIGRSYEGKKYQHKQYDQVMRVIQGEIGPVIREELEMAKAAAPVVGAGIAQLSVLSGTLVAMDVLKKAYLFRFDHQASPEAATPDLPIEAVGSGQAIADPFLAFIRRLFWPKKLPNVNEGVFAVLWTLHHAIEVSPGGVALPIQIAVLQGGKARELPEDELQEHHTAIDAAEQRCANVLPAMTATASGPMPIPPTATPPAS
jgi:Proteasome subunit